MKLNDANLNVLFFLLTLLAAVVYVVLNGASEDLLILAGILAAAMLILLAIRGFKRSFASNLPIFASFWMLFYVALPTAGTFTPEIAAGVFPRVLSYLFRSGGLLIVAIVALILIQKFAKDSRHFLFYILRYLACGLILSLICMSTVYAVLPVEAETIRAVLVGPLLFGGLCLCADLTSSFDKKPVSHLPAFFLLSLTFSAVILFFQADGLWRMERILLGMEHRAICAGGVILLGALLLAKKNSLDDWDSQLKGYSSHITACSLFAWAAYSLLTLAWPQFFQQYVFFFGVPVAMVLYVFLRYFHPNCLPLMDRSDNTFLAAFWGVALVLVLAAGRTVLIRPFYLVLLAFLLVARYICRVLADKGQHPLVMHAFWGVAALLLLLGTRLDLSVAGPSLLKLAAILLTALFWCVICFFLERAANDDTHIYDREYAAALRLRTLIPSAMAAISLILLLFL